MKWLSPRSNSEASEMLSIPGSCIVAGCTAVPPRSLLYDESGPLIDLSKLTNLHQIERKGDTLSIGAMVSIEMLASSEHVLVNLPLLAHVAKQVGDSVIRGQATLGGNLMAMGGWEMPAVLLALGASLRVEGQIGERTLDAKLLCHPDFSLARGELLVGIDIEVKRSIRWTYRRATTNGGAYLCGVAGTRTASGVGLYLAGGANYPIHLANFKEVPSLRSDALARGEYRRHLVSVLIKDALAELGA